MKNKINNSENVFNLITRKIVKEELETYDRKWDSRFSQLEEKYDVLDSKFDRYRDEIMTGIDQVTGILRKHDEQFEILKGNHYRLLALEERVDILERPRP